LAKYRKGFRMKKSYILIEFDGESSSFDINVEHHAHLFTALMGIESFTCAETGLDIVDLREILEEAKGNLEVKPKEPFDPSLITDEDERNC
jgi:hypothetical protein